MQFRFAATTLWLGLVWQAASSIVHISVDVDVKRCFGSPCVTGFPRSKFMNVHADPDEYVWKTEKRGEVFYGDYRTSLGRRFLNSVMQQTTEDAANPGWPNISALKAKCAETAASVNSAWPPSAVNMVS